MGERLFLAQVTAEKKAAVLKCGMWIHKELPKEEPGSKTRARRLFPDDWRPTEAMQGHNIGINEVKGKFILRWKKSENHSISLRLNAPMEAVPKSGSESRAVSFTACGLDIVDAAGKAFLPSTLDNKLAKASIPRKHFLSTEPGSDLVDLWKAVLSHDGIQILEEKAEGAIIWGSERCVDRIARNSKSETPRQSRPPRRSDALYLLDEFLRERFPEGGIFRTQSKEKMRGSTEDLQAFVEFLKQPQYIRHPYSAPPLGDLT
ncbi:hypothetical protein VTL71DRAFT_3446 [Oculimacula yallundae]|uniref:Uncharacterized protein n=1 Tax=Oculimacula yallundae TaxID=86028 RepID=A0ABR4C924_9HELO